MLTTQAGILLQVSSGNAWFTLIGFMGMYTVLSIVFLSLVYRVFERGPDLWVLMAMATKNQGTTANGKKGRLSY